MRRSLKLIMGPVMLAIAVGATPATARTSQGGSAAIGNGPSSADVAMARSSVVPGEAVVRFERGTTSGERLAARRATDVELDHALRISQAQVVEVDGSVVAAVRRLERQPGIAYAQPNYRYQALAVAPNDTFFGDLWGLEDTPPPNPGVDALEAWDTTRGAGQVIAVVDTGVALDHPDLIGNLWDGPGSMHGYDYVDDDTVPDDYNFHGTHVAGTAAAVDDNALGTAGVAPDAEIMAVRVLDGNGSGSSDDIANGIAFAAQNGADVINLSLGGPADVTDEVMSDAVAVADGLDAVVVAAAGNEAGDNDATPTTPCTLPHNNLLCVAAITESGALAGFSNFGRTTVDVGAPGTNILSAETDYASVFANSLDSSTGWLTGTLNGGVPWGFVASPRTEGTASAADSPVTVANPLGRYGQADDPEQYAQSILVRATGISLLGETGCRMRFDLRSDLELDFDYLFAGATNDVDDDEGFYFTGSSSGSFFEEDASISAFDGQPLVKPEFVLLSDDTIQKDGAYVDDLNVLCRDGSYSDAPPPTGNYVEFQGTSMATPHVAGVAALVGAAAPSASDTEIVAAIEAGGLPLPSLASRTVTGCAVDAAGAIGVALGAPDPNRCPAPASVPPPPPSVLTTPPPTPIPTPPAKPDLSGSPSKIRVSRRGGFRYPFRATPLLTGKAGFRTLRRAIVSRRAHVTLARKSFTVGGGGKVVLRLKLSKAKLRTVRRNKTLLVRVTVTVRSASGLMSKATKRLILEAPKRRR
jgi:thermitase